MRSAWTFTFLVSEDLSWSASTPAYNKYCTSRECSGGTTQRQGCWWPFTAHSTTTVWCAGGSAEDRKALRRVVKAAEKIIGCPLPSAEDTATSRYLSRATNNIKDSTHLSINLFGLLPCGSRWRSAGARTSRFRDSFFPKAICTLNKKNCKAHSLHTVLTDLMTYVSYAACVI